MTYSLQVTFKSNEHPYTTTYTPLAAHQPIDDEAACEWAAEMAMGLGPSYICALYKDGSLFYDAAEDAGDDEETLV